MPPMIQPSQSSESAATGPNASTATGVITVVEKKKTIAEIAESNTKMTAPATACC